MPIQIAIEESRKEIINSINDICNKYKINYYFLDYIIKDLHDEIKVKKEIELKKDYDIYNEKSDNDES